MAYLLPIGCNRFITRFQGDKIFFRYFGMSGRSWRVFFCTKPKGHIEKKSNLQPDEHEDRADTEQRVPGLGLPVSLDDLLDGVDEGFGAAGDAQQRANLRRADNDGGRIGEAANHRHTDEVHEEAEMQQPDRGYQAARQEAQQHLRGNQTRIFAAGVVCLRVYMIWVIGLFWYSVSGLCGYSWILKKRYEDTTFIRQVEIREIVTFCTAFNFWKIHCVKHQENKIKIIKLPTTLERNVLRSLKERTTSVQSTKEIFCLKYFSFL